MEFNKIIKEHFKSSGLRDEALYWHVLYYFATHSGKVITPSSASKYFAIHCGQSVSHNTVKKYFEAISKDFLLEMKRIYVKPLLERQISGDLSHNKTYFFRNAQLFDFLYEEGEKAFSLDSQRAHRQYEAIREKMLLCKRLLEKQFTLKSGVYVYFTRNEENVSKRLTLSIDFVAEKEDITIYYVFPEHENLPYQKQLLLSLKSIGNQVPIVIVIPENTPELDCAAEGIRSLPLSQILLEN